MSRPSPWSAGRLTALLADREHLLLDFDGPVCRLFARRPASGIAERLLDLVPSWLRREVASPDPHEILRRVHARDPAGAVAIELALTDEESEAAATAAPTPSAHQLIATARASGRTVSIVTNNASRAVGTYLALHDLTPYVDAVAARPPDGVGRMKPHPALVKQALNEVAAGPERSMLIGNSPSDIEAASAAGVASIGFLDRPTKRRCMATATALVTNLAELVDALGPQADGRRV